MGWRVRVEERRGVFLRLILTLTKFHRVNGDIELERDGLGQKSGENYLL